MIVEFCDERNRLEGALRTLLERAAACTVEEELCREAAGMPLYLSVTSVSPEEIREINRDHRGIDKVTDVLSFPQYEGKKEVLAAVEQYGTVSALPLGDVVLCCEKAEEQSEEYGTTREREHVYLFVHSLLHLLGYDHMEDEERHAMREREEHIMQRLGLGREGEDD